ncbi:Flagellar filament outer layer protein Flaa [Alkalispirochaeta americana]|uniref:Flagellar filament outer layer protein Flaa n=1 Tax=Alkalispirochaeta americana TaxID=159291 RepID=A0A1N6PAV4_9SPIO|nr:flagellar filament outer layer protein FlaA [Alkalispirochaeta americana]SIQ01376.1 Flagellar filament outer layer protein Flaa [Alkalispirochaeta americana]
MRRSVLFVLVFLLVLSVVVADEAVLVDFATLTADYPADNPRHNERTLVDYSIAAGTSFTEEEKAEMRISLAIDSWEVDLASSSRNVTTIGDSMVRSAPVRAGASRYEGETVMGVRVRFPTEPFNSWALIRPPFEIPAFADLEVVDDTGQLAVPQEEQGRGRKFDNFGVVKNVGVLRSVSMNVHGLNFPHAIAIVLQDENNREHEILMGNLQFDGWRTLEWRNPSYITEVRNREVRTMPLYPNLSPMRKLIGIRVYRDASQVGGDFITYIKDISLTYDRAVLQLERDIDDEAVWGILQVREEARRDAELIRLGNIQVLRYLEDRKMHDPDAIDG